MAYVTKNKKTRGLLLREGLANYSILDLPRADKLGTFSDSKRAPIHRWFQYPAGFSFKAVEYVLDLQEMRPGHVVYDPFTGTGTTNVVCKSRGIQSIGIEAHPFVQKVALLKTSWNYDLQELQSVIENLLFELNFSSADKSEDLHGIPELVRKCFSEGNLRKLLRIKTSVGRIRDAKIRDFLSLALTATLRRASAAATGWPYIAPKKKISEKDAVRAFTEQLSEMWNDIRSIPGNKREVPTSILLGDARHSPLEDESVDFSFTSPPYLNNYDYADRTRLEIYFNGFASTWQEISETVRTKLIVSATTQINRNDYSLSEVISPTLTKLSPAISKALEAKVFQLSEIRNSKGGKKSYDIMVAQYFNDMTLALLDNYRVLRRGSCFMLILGDSAPYGIHVATEELLGRIGLAIGFRDYSITKLRERGNKWKANPQRHHVPLQESMLTLRK